MRTATHRLLWPLAYLILVGAGRCVAASANSTEIAASAHLTHAGTPLAAVLPESALHLIEEITFSLAEVGPFACIPTSDNRTDTDWYMYNI